jgi:hypothetical protein
MATKTGGGLLGRADSTLVQGALKTELANIALTCEVYIKCKQKM